MQTSRKILPSVIAQKENRIQGKIIIDRFRIIDWTKRNVGDVVYLTSITVVHDVDNLAVSSRRSKNRLPILEGSKCVFAI